MRYSDLLINIGGCTVRVRADASKNLSRKSLLLAPACLTRAKRPQAIFTERYIRSFRPSLRGLRIKTDNKYWSLHEGVSKAIITIKPTSRHGTITAILNPAMDCGDIVLEDRHEEWLTTRLWRLLMDNVFSCNGVFAFHASAVADGPHGYVFFGESGAGKTTMSKLWREKGAAVIHDDLVLLRRRHGRIAVSSAEIIRRKAMPGADSLRGAPVKKVFFIKHGSKNKILFMDRCSILKALIPQSRSLIWNTRAWKRMADFHAHLASSISGYGLEFVPDVRCVDLIRDYQ
jgi:hypothetical protein